MTTRARFRTLLFAVVLAGGCGAVPDTLLETVEQSAKEAIEEKIDELVDQFVDDLLNSAELPSETPE